METRRRIAWAALAAFALDQLSKVFVLFGLNLLDVYEIKVLPPFLVFRMAWNTGVNFGLFSGAEARWVLIAIALALVVAIYIWLMREKPGRWGAISGGILIGGALGNVLDRLIYGAVADFLNMSCCGFSNPYSFNIADIAVFVGAAGLILFTGEKKR
ncbi:MAG: signal peptidase II [Paracoccaceae bacterium]|nr:signal peptidase II [Paracoccaceae bacterium]MDG1739659.1 signal peptidase II [Paracoccaceae bacterium]MDG2257186.1 signal peptidase II [Paracoccaceae bacterium]